MDSIIGRVVATILTLILIAGVGFMAYNGFTQNKVSTMSSGVATLVQAVQHDYAEYPTFSGLSTMPVNALSSVKNLWGSTTPTGTVGTAGGLIDPWGDAMEVYSGGSTTDTVPSAATNVTSGDFVIEDAGTDFGTSTCKTVAMSIGASAFETVVGSTLLNGAAGQSINPTTAATACNGGNKPIYWIFGH